MPNDLRNASLISLGERDQGSECEDKAQPTACGHVQRLAV